MAQPAPKSLPTLIDELRQLVVAYARQETVQPLKSLGRFVLFGVAGSLLLGVGLTLWSIALLRALQTETDTTFHDHLSWAPYGITLLVAALIIVLAVLRATRKRAKP